jgi:hypothetical protein
MCSPPQAGNVLGRIMLAIVAVSIFSAALAITASAARVMFSMARDGRLPFSKALSKVSPRTGTPLMPSFAVCAIAIGILLLGLGSSSVFGDITSVAVVIVYLAYLLVTVPLLIPAPARQSGLLRRRTAAGLFHPRALGPADQHRGRRVWRGAVDRCRLAARGDL